MANERIPNDPYRTDPSDESFNRAARVDNEYQFDPELREGPVSRARITLFAVAIALILGALFYALNNSSVHQATTNPPAQTTQTQPPPPRVNNGPGVTTGSATNRPMPPQSSPSGTEVDRSANPPGNENQQN